MQVKTAMRYHHTPIRMAKIKINSTKYYMDVTDVEKIQLSYHADGNVK